MSLLIESIKLLNGEFYNLSYHEQRMNRSLRMLCGVQEYFDLELLLQKTDRPLDGLFKCRIVYDDESQDIEFIPYQPKNISTLRVVEHDHIHYEFKYKDRKTIDRLFELRRGCDDILIVKKGFVTDSSYSNIVFRKGNRWFTPWSALLKGTMRQNLLEHNIIEEEDIRKEDIHDFEACKLINAMIGFNSAEIKVSKIVF